MNARWARPSFAGASRKPASQRPVGKAQIVGKQQLTASVFGLLAITVPWSTIFIAVEKRRCGYCLIRGSDGIPILANYNTDGQCV